MTAATRRWRQAQGAEHTEATQEAPSARSLSMVVNSVAVMGGKAGEMALGFFFWVVAARQFAPEQVGLAAGAVSAMMLCTQLAQLGVGSALITRLPGKARRPARLLNTAFTMAGVAAVYTGLAFLLVATGVLPELEVVASTPAFAALFLVMVILGTVGIALDQTSIALRRGDHVLVRGLAFGLVALALIIALPRVTDATGAIVVVSPWAVAAATFCLIAALQLRRPLGNYRYRPQLHRAHAVDLVRVGLPNWLLTLTERAPGLVLPIVVTELLAPAANATWYAVWMMAWAVFIVPVSVGLALFAELSNRPDGIEATVWRAVRASLALGLVAAVSVALLAPHILSLLGEQYADAGTTPLRVLVVGFAPLCLVQAYFGRCRARQAFSEAIATGVVSGVVSVVAAAAVGISFGLVGMAVAWLAVQTATAAWAAGRLTTMSQPTGSFRSDSAEESPREDGDASSGHAAVLRLPTSIARGGKRDGHTAPVVLGARPGAPLHRLHAAPVGAGTAAVAATTELRPGKRSLTSVIAMVVPFGVLVGTVVVWALSLRAVDVDRMNDLGLISVLPPAAFAAFGLLIVSFCLALRRPAAPSALLLAHVVALVVMLYGLPALVEDVPRFAVTWRHLGVTESIMRTEAVDPLIDAYFNWPGFFVLSAFLVEAVGIHDVSRVVGWAPVFFNILYLAPLLVILRSAMASERLVWLGAWIFFLANWIGQDYFAPQAVAFFLYLVVLAIVLRWFQTASEEGTTPTIPIGRRPPLGAVALRRPWSWYASLARRDGADLPAAPPAPVRAGLVAVAILLMIALVAGHQLTPFALLLGLTVLVVLGRCTARGLPLILAVLIGAWLSFMAIKYVRGHLDTLIGGLGALEESLQSNVGNRLQGSFHHELVVKARLLTTAFVWGLAFTGAIYALRRRRPRLAFAALAVAPLGLVAAQPYGGEVLLRAYLFGLPFVAYYVATLFAPEPGKRATWARTAAIGAVSSTLLLGLLLSRYGNERMDYFSHDEVAAVNNVYEVAPPGSRLVALGYSLPWKFRDYEKFRYEILTDFEGWSDIGAADTQARLLADRAVRHLSRTDATTFLVVTRSQRAELELSGYPPALIGRLRRALSRTSGVELVYRNDDAEVWRFDPSRGSG